MFFYQHIIRKTTDWNEENFVLPRDFCSQHINKTRYNYSLRTNVLFPSYFPCDPPYVTDELREADAFQDSMKKLKTEMEALQNQMMNSVPFYSSRYKVIKHFDHQLNDDFQLRFSFLKIEIKGCCRELM